MLTTAEMYEISRKNGKYTFTPNTIRFWNAKIHFPPDKYNMFIESVDNFDRSKAIYCVKCFDPTNGEVTTLNDFGHEEFATLAEAETFRKKVCLALNSLKDCYRETEVLNDYRAITSSHHNATGVFKVISNHGTSFEINTNNFSRFVCG